jgi:hypothetical protein
MKANERPKPVRAGVMLLYAALAVAGLRSMVEAATTAELLGTAFLRLMLFIIFVVLGVMALLIAAVGRGKNWARITMLVSFLLSMFTSIVPLLQSIRDRPLSCLLGLVQFILQLGALIFLFQKEGSAWFRAKARCGHDGA